MGEAHLRWLYRAYKRGELTDLPIPADLNPLEFSQQFAAVLARAVSNNGEFLVFINMADLPVGLVMLQKSMVYDRIRAFPHVAWFAEATARQRIEIGLRFILDLKKSALVVSEATEANWRFYEHLCKYGVLRRVGTIRDAFGAGGRTAIYQSVGK